jgi:hypothetical protein
MSPVPTLKDWTLADTPDGRLELVGTLVDDPARGTVDDFHAGPVRRIVGLRLVMAGGGTIYRLLPQPLHRRMDPALLQRLGPAAWREKTDNPTRENRS